mgnify:CR=1 FL=1
MWSAWSASTGSAGSGTVPLLQSTADTNIIFVNIDWKRSRHDNEGSTRRNMTALADTISSIVTSMKPAVICCCEVGEAMNPMTKELMSAVADTIRTEWEASATEHPAISFLFEEGAPYLTIWHGNQCQCTHGRILEKVYDVPGHRRTAQAFLCIMPGESDEECIDVVNVHAPSGKKKLTDSQRYQLIQNLLQSSSMARAGTRIGDGKFLLGGDMNTTEICFSQILNKLRSLGILKTSSQLLFPMWGKPGDMCVVGQGRAYLWLLQGAPYKAWDLSVADAFFPALTFGGLHTNLDGQVLSSFGDIIPGLYAAGRNTAGIPTAPYIASGLSVGDCTFFGRRAGRAVAALDGGLS